MPPEKYSIDLEEERLKEIVDDELFLKNIINNSIIIDNCEVPYLK